MAKEIPPFGSEHRIKADVDINSTAYQAYLKKNREREILREMHGGDTVMGVEGMRKAVLGVDEHAKEVLKKKYSN